ncbi:hypothetical protein ACEQPO_01425 [Bacillus sp. SL00103]
MAKKYGISASTVSSRFKISKKRSRKNKRRRYSIRKDAAPSLGQRLF